MALLETVKSPIHDLRLMMGKSNHPKITNDTLLCLRLIAKYDVDHNDTIQIDMNHNM